MQYPEDMNDTKKTYETRGLLAGAYKASNPKSNLTHTIEAESPTEFGDRVLCKRVELDNLVDSCGMYDAINEPPTCPHCLRADPRFKA